MKKNIKSLLILSTVSLASFFISSCKFNYVESSYLKRPDVEIKNAGIVIRGAYISSDSSYINVYRQDVSISDTGPVENVAILFPKGDTHDNQTYMYVDETIIKDAKYRYYVRFADSKGNRNRTEWSEEISNPNSTYTDASKFKYSFDGTACYLYDKTSKQLTFMVGDTETDFTSPYVTKPEITDFDTLYKTAIVFKTGDIIKVFDIDTPKSINLLSLLPQEFYNVDIEILGVVGQARELVTPEEGDPVLKSIKWTNLQRINIKGTAENPVSDNIIVIQTANSQANGFDYSTTADNED